jgi:hypothetical protein
MLNQTPYMVHAIDDMTVTVTATVVGLESLGFSRDDVLAASSVAINVRSGALNVRWTGKEPDTTETGGWLIQGQQVIAGAMNLAMLRICRSGSEDAVATFVLE